MTSENEWRVTNSLLLAATISGAGILFLLLYESDKSFNNNRYIPRVSQVREGYVAPSKIEILVENPDNGQLPVSVMSIDKQKYLFKYEQGKPVLLPYEVKVQILEKEEVK